MAIGMTDDPAAGAIEALRAHQEAQGMRFEDPDAEVAAPDRDGTIPGWMLRDEEVR